MNCARSPEICAIGGRETQDKVTQVLRDGRFWIFMISIIIVAIVSSIIMNKGLQQQEIPSWTPPSGVFVVVWMFLYAVLAFVCYFAVINGTQRQQWGIYITFFITMILLLSWVWSFAKQAYQAGIIIIGLLIIVAIALFIQVWMIDNIYSFILLAYIIWLFVALFFNIKWQSDSVNNMELSDVEITVEDDSPELPSRGESDSGECDDKSKHKDSSQIETINI